MIPQQTRDAILALRQRQTSIRKIGTILKISKNTVRAVLRGKPPTRRPGTARREQVLSLAAPLLPACEGNIVRLKELLLERHGQNVPYSTLTRLVRQAHLKDGPKERVGSYSFEPGEEMQFDTSPHRLLLGGKPTLAQCAALVFAYSRKAFIQYYPVFTRLEARHFLSETFGFMGGVCANCTIDNTSVVVASGAGPNAEIAPEMEAFSRVFGFRFVPHRVGDPDRKARVERIFSYVQGNFLPGRTFDDWHELNLKATQWSVEVANRKVKRSLGMSPDAAFLVEKPYLQPLPPFIPPVYQTLSRVVDSEGFVHLDTNRYSVPERFIGSKAQVLKFFDRIQVFCENRKIAEHERRIAQHDRRITDPAHHLVRSASAPPTPCPEEKALIGSSELLDQFVHEIKKRSHGRGTKTLKRLLDLKRTYPEEPFLTACEQALQFGLFDLARIERMILSLIAGNFFQIPDEEDET